jgi:hypothetical protein
VKINSGCDLDENKLLLKPFKKKFHSTHELRPGAGYVRTPSNKKIGLKGARDVDFPSRFIFLTNLKVRDSHF